MNSKRHEFTLRSFYGLLAHISPDLQKRSKVSFVYVYKQFYIQLAATAETRTWKYIKTRLRIFPLKHAALFRITLRVFIR